MDRIGMDESGDTTGLRSVRERYAVWDRYDTKMFNAKRA